MASLNECKFIGNLGKDPETRYTPSGDAVCSFSVACSEKWNDKNTGEKKESTEWVNITAFGKLGEICGKYLSKGSKVYISGKMKTDKYKDKSGVEKYSTKIIAKDMIMLDSKNQTAVNQGASVAANNPAQHASGNSNQPNPTYGGMASSTAAAPNDFEDNDVEDIPW